MKSRKRKKIFVLVIPQFEDIFHSYYFGEIIKGASLAASRLKLDLLVHIVDRSDHHTWLDSSLLDLEFVDGILFADIDNDVAIVKKAIKKQVPTLVLNNFLPEPINCVSIDNYHAGMDVVRHLIQLGHRQIATICGDLGTQAGQMRLEGFRAALAEAGIKVPAYYVTKGGFLRTPARFAAERLLKFKTRPTAIFAASDVMALEALDVAKKHGVKVPDEVSIIGFDDNPIAYNSYVPLTTVFQPLVEMGRLGVEKLKEITAGKAALPVKVMLQAKVVVRRSTAAVK